MRYWIVFVGGGLGALTRYVAGSAIMALYGGLFPLGTLIINITGSFLIGLLMTLLTERWHLDPIWRLALVVGFLADIQPSPASSMKLIEPFARAASGSQS